MRSRPTRSSGRTATAMDLVTTPTSQAATIAWTSLENRLKKADTAARTRIWTGTLTSTISSRPTTSSGPISTATAGVTTTSGKTTQRSTLRTVKSSWCCENSEAMHSRRSPASGPTWTGTAGATIKTAPTASTTSHFDPRSGTTLTATVMATTPLLGPTNPMRVPKYPAPPPPTKNTVVRIPITTACATMPTRARGTPRFRRGRDPRQPAASRPIPACNPTTVAAVRRC